MSTNRLGEGLNVLALIKGHNTENEERYVFLFDDDSRTDLPTTTSTGSKALRESSDRA